MKIGVAALVGGLLGVPGFLCFLLAFGTDYWLLASDDCGWFKQLRSTAYTVVQTNSTEVIHRVSLKKKNKTLDR